MAVTTLNGRANVAADESPLFIKRGSRLTVIGCRACGIRAVFSVNDRRLVARLFDRAERSHVCVRRG